MDPDPNNNDSFITIYIIVLFILLILSAFFSLCETAYSSSNVIKLENQSKTNKKAKLAYKIATNYDKFISTILVGNNLVNITAATMATVLFVRYVGQDLGPTIATIVNTIIVLIFGEVLPKSIGRENPELFAKINSYPLYFFYIIFFPVVYLLLGIQSLAKKIFSNKKSKSDQLTEEEFSMLVEDMNEDGVLNDIEEDIIQKTIDYGDCKVGEVMTKAEDVIHIKANDSMDKIKKAFADSDFSRLVVCKDKSIQSAYGIIHQKDLFKFLVEGGEDINSIIIKDPIFAKPSHKISRLLKKFQSAHQHLAIVKEDNKVVGIITMEDILEELVGEINDENDDD